jgi:hypothetical protein
MYVSLSIDSDQVLNRTRLSIMPDLCNHFLLTTRDNIDSKKTNDYNIREIVDYRVSTVDSYSVACHHLRRFYRSAYIAALAPWSPHGLHDDDGFQPQTVGAF